MSKDNPFGVIPTQNSASSVLHLDIDAATFETRVFVPKSRTSKQTKTRSKFITLKRESKFLSVKEPHETLQDRKKQWADSIKPKEQVIEDKVKIHIPKKEKIDFLNSLHDNQESFYAFFMKEVIPIYAAIEPSLKQTVEHVSHILKTDAEIELEQKVFDMLNDAIALKIFEFASEQLSLDKALRKVIRDKYFSPSYGLVQGLKKK